MKNLAMNSPPPLIQHVICVVVTTVSVLFARTAIADKSFGNADPTA